MSIIDQAPTELADAIREFWPPDQWDNAAAISQLESNWQWDAELDSTQGGRIPCGTVIDTRDGVKITAEHSISYFQINACNYPDWNPGHFFNTRQNAGTAHALWMERGWEPWYFSAKKLGIL
jgi:hypothetical protein